MSDAGAKGAGGNKEGAREFLKNTMGWSDKAIRKFENESVAEAEIPYLTIIKMSDAELVKTLNKLEAKTDKSAEDKKTEKTLRIAVNGRRVLRRTFRR